MLVTAGATEALAGALLGLLDTGDEVVAVRADVRQLPGVHRAGRRGRQAGHAAPAGPTPFDPDELRAAITPKTKLLLINTPHNPTGHGARRATSWR